MNILRFSRHLLKFPSTAPTFMFTTTDLLDDIQAIVIKKVAEMPTVDSAKVNLDSHLLNDLDIDSLT